MKLQILVPHWKELSEEMTPLLDSLKLQQGVDFSDFGVIIVYDGREATWLPEEMWRRSYPFDICGGFCTGWSRHPCYRYYTC